MNYYDKADVVNNLEKEIFNLGIDSKFKENPAFNEILENYIRWFQNANSIAVQKEEGKIIFNWNSNDSTKHSMIISSYQPQVLNCITLDKKETLDGIVTTEKIAQENTASINDNGDITLIKNHSLVNNVNSKVGKCDNFTNAEKFIFTKDGIMQLKEEITFPQLELADDIKSVNVGSMLFAARQDLNSPSNYFKTKRSFRRDMLDTAYYTYENNVNDEKFSYIGPLNQEHGLKNMKQIGGYEHPMPVVIPTLSSEQIDAMIQRESDPKVREGLKKLAVGRENYYYNPELDKNYTSETVGKHFA